MSSEGEKSLQLVELLPWVKANLSAGKPSALWSLEALEECSICVLDPTGLHEVDGCGGGLVFVSIRTRFNRHCAFLFNMLYPKGFIEIQYLVCSEWTVPSARFLAKASKWLWITCNGCTHLSCLVCPKDAQEGKHWCIFIYSTICLLSFPFCAIRLETLDNLSHAQWSNQQQWFVSEAQGKKTLGHSMVPPTKGPKDEG